MPKLKTNKSLAKRVRFTKRGKVKRQHAYTGHILTKKSRRRKRGLRQPDLVSGYQLNSIKRLMPYGDK